MFRFSLAALTLLATIAVCSASTLKTIESHLNGTGLLQAPPAAVNVALGECVTTDPKHPDSYVREILRERVTDADTLAPELTETAILALGAQPSKGAVVDVVTAAVKCAPNAVLRIVRAAVRTAPGEFAAAITRAAVRAVPDPYAPAAGVLSVDGTEQTQRVSDGKDGKDFKDYKNVVNREETIGEAIVQAAFQARDGLDLTALNAAANAGLELLPPTNPLYPGVRDVSHITLVDFGHRTPPLVTPNPTPAPPPQVPLTPPGGFVTR